MRFALAGRVRIAFSPPVSVWDLAAVVPLGILGLLAAGGVKVRVAPTTLYVKFADAALAT